jgi:hypothetical protein
MVGRRIAWVWTVVFLSSLCAASAGQAEPGDITISFVSDASWQSFAMNPDGSEGALLGPAQCVCADPGWGGCSQEAIQGISSTIVSSCVIWRAGVTSASLADLQGAYFEKQIYIAGVPQAGTIRIAVDDFAEVRINGNVVGSIGSISDLGSAANAQHALVQFDLSPHLLTGINTIVIRAQNGPYWFSGLGCNPCNYNGNPAAIVLTGALSFTAPVATRPHSWGSLKAIYR